MSGNPLSVNDPKVTSRCRDVLFLAEKGVVDNTDSFEMSDPSLGRWGGASFVAYGKCLFDAGDIAGSGYAFKTALQLSPNEPGALDGLLNIFLASTEIQTEEAEKFADMKLGQDPNDPVALCLQSSFLSKKDPPKAETSFAKSEALYKQSQQTSAELDLCIASSYLRSGKLDEPLVILQSAMQKKDNPKIAYRLASIYNMKGEFQKAKELLEALVAKNPNYISGLKLLGDLYLNQFKENSLAEPIYKKLIDLVPTEAEYLIALAQISRDAGRDKEADHYLGLAAKVNPKALLEPAELALAAKMYQEYLKTRKKLASVHGEDDSDERKQLDQKLTDYLIEQSEATGFSFSCAEENVLKWGEMKNVADALVEAEPDFLIGRYLHARGLWRLAYCRRHKSEVWHDGLVSAALADTEKILEDATKLSPQFKYLTLMEQAFVLTRKIKESSKEVTLEEEGYNKLIEQNYDAIIQESADEGLKNEARLGKAWLSYYSNVYDDAIRRFEAIGLSTEPSVSDKNRAEAHRGIALTLYYLGVQNYDLGDFESAEAAFLRSVEHFNKAAEHEAKHKEKGVQIDKPANASQEQRLFSAIESHRMKLSPSEEMDTILNKGWSLNLLGKIKKERATALANELKKPRSDLLFLCGTSLKECQENINTLTKEAVKYTEQARECFEKVLELAPKNPEARRFLGATRIRLGFWDGGVKDMLTALDPKNMTEQAWDAREKIIASAESLLELTRKSPSSKYIRRTTAVLKQFGPAGICGNPALLPQLGKLEASLKQNPRGGVFTKYFSECRKTPQKLQQSQQLQQPQQPQKIQQPHKIWHPQKIQKIQKLTKPL